MSVSCSSVDELILEVNALSKQAHALRLDAQAVSQAVVDLLTECEDMDHEEKERLRSTLERSNALVWSMKFSGLP